MECGVPLRRLNAELLPRRPSWQLHWVAGWDPAHGEYRAMIAGYYGHADVMRGWIDGDRLTFETIGDPPVRLRLTWDITDPASMRWRNEVSVGGGPWSLVEEYHCQPIGNHASAPTAHQRERRQAAAPPRCNAPANRALVTSVAANWP